LRYLASIILLKLFGLLFSDPHSFVPIPLSLPSAFGCGFAALGNL